VADLKAIAKKRPTPTPKGTAAASSSSSSSSWAIGASKKFGGK